MQLVSLSLIQWIVIYPVDSAIQLLNNWGQVCIGFLCGKAKAPETKREEKREKGIWYSYCPPPPAKIKKVKGYGL